MGRQQNQSATAKTVVPFLGSDENGNLVTARRLSEIVEEPVEWLMDQTIPARCVSLIVGCPGAGKSTFGAYLCAKARRPAIMPGSEESVKSALVPRMRSAGVNLDNGLLLDGKPWVLPRDRHRLFQVVQDGGIDLLWIDPIDNLMGDQNENDGQAVRAMLESLHWIGEKCKCTIVAARHPGKDPKNVCPGSRQWRAVPRAVIRLNIDEGPPERRFIVVMKSYQGGKPAPREFMVEKIGSTSARFGLGDYVTEAVATMGEADERIERWKIDEAELFLRGVLADGEQLSKVIFELGEGERLNERVISRAGRRVGVEKRREGIGRDHRSYWSLPIVTSESSVSATPATPDTERETGGGVSPRVVRSKKRTAKKNSTSSATEAKSSQNKEGK